MQKPFGKWSKRFTLNVIRWAATYLVSIGDDEYNRFIGNVQMERGIRAVYGKAIVQQLNQSSKLLEMFK